MRPVLFASFLLLLGCGSGAVSTTAPARVEEKPLPAVCASLVRPPGPPAASHTMASSLYQQSGGFFTCRPPATSADGTVALRSVNAPQQLDIVSPSGAVLASFAEAPSANMFGKPHGFISASALSAISFLQSWDSSGR